MYVLGPLPGVAEGSVFANRKVLAQSGVHRQTMMGIAWGAGGGPAESIVVSGGYEDEEDWGDTLLYTGMGGNDGAGRQVRDQVRDRGNLALIRSLEGRTPVRVIRGANHRSAHSPSQGLRYDGAFRVTDAFYEPGRSGFRVWRFLLDRERPVPAPQPWTLPQRSIIDLYEASCQVCGHTVRTRVGRLAVPWHIVPTHKPHGGGDVVSNLLCLCPNHAEELGSGVIVVSIDGRLIGAPGRLHVHREHAIDASGLRYRAERYGPSGGR
jgi:putative restriction endonuclease